MSPNGFEMMVTSKISARSPESYQVVLYQNDKYSLYKKKRKHYIIFNNLRTFKDEHFKLTCDLHWHVPYQ